MFKEQHAHASWAPQPPLCQPVPPTSGPTWMELLPIQVTPGIVLPSLQGRALGTHGPDHLENCFLGSELQLLRPRLH